MSGGIERDWSTACECEKESEEREPHHEPDEIEYAMDVIETAGKEIGII